MSEVDPNDDSIWRWVLKHYRFDPERGERRRVVVAISPADLAGLEETLDVLSDAEALADIR